MRILKILIAIIIATFFIISCEKDSKYDPIYPSIRIVSSEKYDTTATDPYEIHNAKISGNNIQIDIKYSGGCGTISAELITDGSLVKTDPPVLECRLIFTDEDPCEAYTSTYFIFELDQIQLSDDQPITINLEGWSGDLLYEY